MLALAGARLVDGTGAPPRDGATVVVDGGRIASVEGQTPPGAEVVDLAGCTLLPGLVDAHVHAGSLATKPDDPAYPYALVRAARDFLAGGVTTVRDLGGYGDTLFALRDAVAEGLVAGPRLVLCGQVISARCPGAAAFPGMYREAEGPDDFRRAVREQVRRGADVVKVMVTGALTVADEDVGPSQLRADELAAVVDEAQRLGRPVAAHAEGAEGIRLAVDAGVDTIEHGEMGRDAPGAIAQMAERGIVLVPTLCVFDAVADPESRFEPWMRERAERLREAAFETVALARREGVQIVAGADAGPHGANARELVRLVEAGLSPLEAIAAGTGAAARVCGVAAETGTIEPGKAADLLAVEGDPLADPSVLADPSRVRLVLRGGTSVGRAV